VKASSPTRIPSKSLLEAGLPIEELYELAKREGNAKKPIYEIHKWWARRLGHVFRTLLLSATTRELKKKGEAQHRRLMQRFYKKNNLRGLRVLDPFMGGGTSIVEALKCGANVIGIDIDPVAWFVTTKQIQPFDEDRFQEAFDNIEAGISSELRNLYRTTDPKTGQPAEIVNAFWVSQFTCPHCKQTIDAHPHYRLSYKTDEQTVFCRQCYTIHELPVDQSWFKCKQCKETTSIARGTVKRGTLICCCGTETALVSLMTPAQPAKKRLFAIEFSRIGDKKPTRVFKKADADDYEIFEAAKRMFQIKATDLVYPMQAINATNRYDGRPVTHGYARYDQLFNERQLYCLARIFEAILQISDEQSREYLLVAFSDSLASNNNLVSYAFGYQKITPLFAIHGYQVPQRPVETNVWGNPDFGRGSFSRCVAKLLEGKRYTLRPFEYRYATDGKAERVFTKETIATETTDLLDFSAERRACLLNQSSTRLSQIPDASVDLILTDPPFYDNLPYSELSDFYYQWLKLYFERSRPGQTILTSTPMDQTLLVKRRTQQQHQAYLDGLLAAMKESNRVLKYSGMLVFTFHHCEPSAWHALGCALRDAQFRVTGTSPVRAEGVSGFHSYDGTPKWDAVLCCRGRTRDTQNLFPAMNFPEKVEQIENEATRWQKRITRAKLPWNNADHASFAFALSLRVIVNDRLTNTQAAELLTLVSSKFPQKGVAERFPAWFNKIKTTASWKCEAP
jgi:DNA modification methylase